MKKFTLLFIVFFLSTPAWYVVATPTEPVNYQATFDLSKIQKKYTKLMHHLGCAENVFGQASDEELDDDFDADEELAAYQAECLAHLKTQKRSALFYNAYQMSLDWAMVVAVTGVIVPVIGRNSEVSKLILSGAAYFTAEVLKTFGKATYDLWYKPSLILETLEETYVKNQCFIPKAIWPNLKLKFMMGRDNPYEQQRSIDFIEFALGLTTFKPQETPTISDTDLKLARQKLTEKIDQFFQKYEEVDEDQIQLLKINAKNFLGQLFGKQAKTRYVHLTGPGGIGKTHFARELVKWIEEICPNSLHLQELNVTALDELEGSIQRPGAFLRVLRNQCHANKIGSVVFIDEANWLSDPMFEAPAKRVFNGDQAKLSTSYFGDGQEGAGLELDMPPLLVIIASNKPITEEALQTRFDCVQFPNPTKQALTEHAYEVALKNELSKSIQGFVKKGKITPKYRSQIDEAIADATNFRAVQSRIPTLMSGWEEEKWGKPKDKAKLSAETPSDETKD